jgi:hypothetical protein
MTVYINQNAFGSIETVDEFDTRREANEALREYQMAFHGGSMYLSSRATKWWRTMEQKHEEAAEPGYGAACAKRAAEASPGDSCIEELVLS